MRRSHIQNSSVSVCVGPQSSVSPPSSPHFLSHLHFPHPHELIELCKVASQVSYRKSKQKKRKDGEGTEGYSRIIVILIFQPTENEPE